MVFVQLLDLHLGTHLDTMRLCTWICTWVRIWKTKLTIQHNRKTQYVLLLRDSSEGKARVRPVLLL